MKLANSRTIYDLEPPGDDNGSPGVSVDVSLVDDQIKLFATDEQMLDRRL